MLGNILYFYHYIFQTYLEVRRNRQKRKQGMYRELMCAECPQYYVGCFSIIITTRKLFKDESVNVKCVYFTPVIFQYYMLLTAG